MTKRRATGIWSVEYYPLVALLRVGTLSDTLRTIVERAKLPHHRAPDLPLISVRNCMHPEVPGLRELLDYLGHSQAEGESRLPNKYAIVWKAAHGTNSTVSSDVVSV